jgi:HK97 family phage prohead protease
MKFHDIKFEVKALAESGMFEGMGSTYGNVDEGLDIVAPGCFSDSLIDWQSKGRMPALLWQHSTREPIGAYKQIAESDAGLYVKGQLCLETQRGAEAYALMKMGALSGLSVGFMTREDSYDQKTGVRTIKKADLFEISPVTFPMNDSARISSVKSIEQIDDLGGVEAYLRDVGAMSASQAKALTVRLMSLARRDAGRVDDSAELKAISALLDKRMAVLTPAT